MWKIPARELPGDRFMPGKMLRELGYLTSRELADQKAVAAANTMTAVVETAGDITQEEVEIGDGILEVGQQVKRRRMLWG